MLHLFLPRCAGKTSRLIAKACVEGCDILVANRGLRESVIDTAKHMGIPGKIDRDPRHGAPSIGDVRVLIPADLKYRDGDHGRDRRPILIGRFMNRPHNESKELSPEAEGPEAGGLNEKTHHHRRRRRRLCSGAPRAAARRQQEGSGREKQSDLGRAKAPQSDPVDPGAGAAARRQLSHAGIRPRDRAQLRRRASAEIQKRSAAPVQIFPAKAPGRAPRRFPA